MKQIKVSNPKWQRRLDYFTGWREIVLVVGMLTLAALAVWAAYYVEKTL